MLTSLVYVLQQVQICTSHALIPLLMQVLSLQDATPLLPSDNVLQQEIPPAGEQNTLMSCLTFSALHNRYYAVVTPVHVTYVFLLSVLQLCVTMQDKLCHLLSMQSTQISRYEQLQLDQQRS